MGKAGESGCKAFKQDPLTLLSPWPSSTMFFPAPSPINHPDLMEYPPNCSSGWIRPTVNLSLLPQTKCLAAGDLTSCYKLVAALVKERLDKGLDRWLMQTQYGFRKARSTAQAIFLARRIQDLSEKSHSARTLILLHWEKGVW